MGDKLSKLIDIDSLGNSQGRSTPLPWGGARGRCQKQMDPPIEASIRYSGSLSVHRRYTLLWSPFGRQDRTKHRVSLAGLCTRSEVTDMGTEKSSLRSLVEKWLVSGPGSPLRVIRFGRTSNGVRFVSIEGLRLAGPMIITFFYHADGGWCVFPPRTGLLGVTSVQPPVVGPSWIT